MAAFSLRLRFLLVGAVAVAIALGIATLGLSFLYDRHAGRAAVADLQLRMDQLIAGIGADANGRPALLRMPDDPRYDAPYSGHYWQVLIGDQAQRSRSLWDLRFDLPAAPLPEAGAQQVEPETGAEMALIALDRSILVGSTPVRVTMALDRAGIAAGRRAFLADLAPYTALLALALIGAGALQLTIGLSPLSRIGARVAALREGRITRLGTDFPAELRPLAAEIDALLENRARDAERARGRAADLAHGLKTPLQALMGEVQRLRDRQDPAAEGIDGIATAMHRHIDRELALSRIALREANAAVDPGTVIAAVIAVLSRTPQGRRIAWQVVQPGPCLARIDRDDLTEALGALMENAARHARRAVIVSVAAEKGRVQIAIVDDGPGIPADALALMQQRGQRSDSSTGEGLGLAIAGETIAAAGGELQLINRENGFEALVSLPRLARMPLQEARSPVPAQPVAQPPAQTPEEGRT